MTDRATRAAVFPIDGQGRIPNWEQGDEGEGEFQQKLINIDEEFGDDDLHGLKFLCADYIPVSKLESATSSLDIFTHMRKEVLIDTQNVDFLLECLGRIHRFDLIKMLGLDPDIVKANFSNLNKVTPYRRLLMELAENMSEADVEKIRFYVSGQIKKNKLSKARSILKVFIVLEQEQIISPEKPEGVADLMTAIGRPDLVSIANDFLGVGMPQRELMVGSGSSNQGRPAGINRTPSAGTMTVSESGSSSSGADGARPANFPVGGDAPEMAVPVGPSMNGYEPQEQSENNCASVREAQPWREPAPIDPQIQDEYLQQIENRIHHITISGGQLNPQQALNRNTRELNRIINAYNPEQIAAGPPVNPLLNPPVNTPVNPPENPTVNTPVGVAESPVAAATRQGLVTDQDGLPEYSMNKRPRGWCVIINNKVFTVPEGQPVINPRNGTDKDAESLQKVFSDLNFVVRRRDNMSDTEMMQYLVDVSHNVNHGLFDCLVVCILTHGVENQVHGSNGKLVSVKDITSTFQANRCPSLAGKPKLFFLQACRGNNKMPGSELERDAPTVEPDGDKEMVPNEADFLIGYSTMEGYASFRSPNSGSWYICKLCELLDRYSARHDLLSILVEVNRQVSRGIAPFEDGTFKQMPAPLVTLTKKVYFK